MIQPLKLARDRWGAATIAAAAVALSIAWFPRAAVAQINAEWTAPARQARHLNPIAPAPQTTARGLEVYRKECMSCHGPAGHGNGPKAADLQTKPADLASEKVQSQTDGALFWKITEGRGDMPNTRNTLTDEERWMVVDYLRTLAAKTP